MLNTYTCDTNKYTFGNKTISLPVVIKDLPKTIEVYGIKLLLKSSFHISLVCVGKILENNPILPTTFIEQVINRFCEFTKNHEISLVGYNNEFRLVENADRVSVIAMADVSNLNTFFDLINLEFGLNLSYPPTHVTIYTLQPDLGIFVTNTEDLQRLTKIITAPVILS